MSHKYLHFPNRRRFLRTASSALAAGGVAPLVWTRSTRGAANDRLNVAAIGVGGRGSGIGHQAGKLGNMLACADVRLGNANRFAKRYEGKCEVYQDYRSILDRDDIDAITCGTPDHWHTEVAIDALESGKHVYCEKPLTLTIGESQRIMEATRRTGRTFQVGTQQRSEYGQNFLKAVVMARAGILGDTLHALSSVGTAKQGGPFDAVEPPSDLNFDFWLGQAPLVDFCPQRASYDFRWWLEYSGGQVTDWGVHHTDIALWALGGEERGVIQVEGTGTFPGIPHGTDVAAFLDGEIKLPNAYNVAHTFDCQMKLENGNTINLLSGKGELIISGERGRIRVNRGSLTGKPVDDIMADSARREWLDEEVRKLYRGMPLQGHMANFFHCVRTGELPISDVWTHCNSVNACHMANIAMLLQRKIQFNPDTYQFDGDDQANRLIARRTRSKWA